jgi:hypothetical protein
VAVGPFIMMDECEADQNNFWTDAWITLTAAYERRERERWAVADEQTRTAMVREAFYQRLFDPFA